MDWNHFEAKITAASTMNRPATLEQWAAQARRDVGQFRTPLVVHRCHGQTTWWVLVLKPGWPRVWLTLPDFLGSLSVWEPI